MRAFLAVVVLLVCWISSAYGQPQPQPQAAKQTKTQKASGSEENPFFIKRQKTPEETKGEADQDADSKANLRIQGDALKVSEKSLIANDGTYRETIRAADAAVAAAAIAGFGAILGIVMLGVAIYQVRMFRAQLNAMDAAEKRAEVESKDRAKDTKDQLKISAHAADAALEQANHLQRAARAYLLSANEEAMLHNGGKVHVIMRVKNFGQTPAHKVKICFFINAVNLPYDGPFDEADFTEASCGTLGPDAVYRASTEIPTALSDIQFKGIQAGIGAIFVWGHIEYEDVFGVKQETKIRMISTKEDFTACELAVCEEGNKAT